MRNHEVFITKQRPEYGVRLTCSSCNEAVECNKEYFGTKYFLAPHISDTKYTFKCSDCEEKPYITHHKKKWTQIALCALTTLEMLVGWAWFARKDVEAFVESHFAQLACNKKESKHWGANLRKKILGPESLICHQTIDGTPFYSLPRKGKLPTGIAEYFPEAILEIKETETGERKYKIKWQGFEERYATWEPLEHVKHCDLFKSSSQGAIPIKKELSGEVSITESSGATHGNEETNTDLAQDAPLSPSFFSFTPYSLRKRKQQDSTDLPDFLDSSFSSSSSSASFPSSPCHSPSSPSYLKKRRATKEFTEEFERNRKTEVPTLHHTFTVKCSTCNASVPVTDLGDRIVSPSCKHWTMECAKCAKGHPRVVFSRPVPLR